MDEFLKEFRLSKEQLQATCKLFCQQLKMGLAKDTHEKADMKCFVTYVQNLPTGAEVGKALALDLGGANFRVLCVTLKGKNDDAVVDAKTFALSHEMMNAPGTKLFDYIADCLSAFVKERGLGGVKLPLGFTFSFPCVQKGLCKSLLVKWTKGFNCEGVVGQDVGQMLKEAIDRRGDVSIDVVAVLNDTIGTLMSCAHRNSGCRIGLIIGTGCNACYVEKSSKAELLEDEYKSNPKICINCEWGAFGENGSLDFIRTEYDRELDRNSLNKGQQIFEKMLSGMYLGELARLVMLKAARCNLIFNKHPLKADVMEKLMERDIIKTRHISDIEGDCPPDYKVTRYILRELFCIDNVSEDDIRWTRMICEAVSVRSGTLVGLGTSALINRMNQSNVIVGVDGSVYRLHPKYEQYMRQAMRRMVNPRLTYDLMLSEDGSGRGAALVAAAALGGGSA